ncbi:fibronectin type III domain-containing protein [candidate division KSB1 bacterium]
MPASADTDPPVIIGFPFETGIDTASVNIVWKTDEPANSTVEIGKKSEWPGNTFQYSGSEISNRHRIYISNLEKGTEYTYIVSSTDVKGNGPTSSTSRSFRTAVGKDITAPVIVFGPGIFSIDTCKAMVVWVTNEISTGYVEFGATTVYGKKSNYSENNLEHKIVLTDLLPNKDYNFRVYSTDLSGNETVSRNFTFKTQEALAYGDTLKPEIVAGPISAEIEYDRAIIKWRTNINTSSIVKYGFTSNYEYEKSADEDRTIQNHKILLSNLLPDTLYNYQVLSRTEDNLEVYSNNFTFRTKFQPDTMPPVITEGPIVAKTEQDKATIKWKTNKLSDSYIDYGLNQSYDHYLKTDTEEGVKFHRMIVTGLDVNTQYDFRISSTGSNGKTVTSGAFTFKTKAVEDTIKPKITAGPALVNIQSNKATIVWKTDEPSDSYILYGENMSNAQEQWNEDQLQGVQEHEIILTNLKPETKYFFRIFSRDMSPRKNRAMSPVKHFYTTAVQDTLSPVIIQGPIVTSQDQSAKFYWVTDELSDSYIYFRIKDGGYNYEFLGDETRVKEHELTMTNLEPGEGYEFVIVSRDFEGNELIWPEGTVLQKGNDGTVKLYKAMQPPGGDGTFVTNEDPDSQLPIIISGPTIVAKTSSSVTIEWKTDENSDSYIEYYLADSLIDIVGDAEYVTDHELVLTNLELATNYGFLAKSTDVSRNGPITSQESVFETLPIVDTDPPVITSGPDIVGLSDDRATIFWKTDESSSSVIEYGTDSLDLNTSKSELDLKQSHNITITNLLPNTKYYYRISSADADNNGPTWSAIKNLTTNSSPDLTEPEISNIRTWNKKNNRITLGWDTDEISDSFIDYGTDETLGNKIALSEKVTIHQMVLTNLDPGTKYYYRVGSVDLSGNIAEATSIDTFSTNVSEDIDAPDTPAGFTVHSGDQAAFLNWNMNTEKDFAGYNIYRENDLIASGVTDTFYYDYGLINSSTYSYKITAYDDNLPDYLVSDPTQDMQAAPSSDNMISSPVPAYPQDGITASYMFTFRADPSQYRSQIRSELTYQYAVSRDSLFYDMVVFKTGVPETGSAVEYELETNLENDQKYWWKVKAFDGIFKSDWSEVFTFTVDTSVTVGIEEETTVPVVFKLYNNYPNPFNPYTTIKFDLPSYSGVTLKVYNILGQEIKTLVSEKMTAGSYKIIWNGRNNYGMQVSSGVYFYRIIAGQYIQTKKMVFLK